LFRSHGCWLVVNSRNPVLPQVLDLSHIKTKDFCKECRTELRKCVD
jgi:hypothetical protein